MIAIISDIHGNLEAFQAVLEDIEKEGIKEIYCAGDVVGYGADPNECVEIVRERNIPCVAGNHDYAVTGKMSLQYFNPVAKEAIEWTMRVIKPENLEFLRKLPLTMHIGKNLLVHAVPSNPASFDYILTLGDAIREFMFFREKICFHGHSHHPVIFIEREKRHGVIFEDEVEIMEDVRYLVNVGSVGQPRDGDPRACYCILREDRIEIRRVPYPIEIAQRKILDAGLHPYLAERLAAGK